MSAPIRTLGVEYHKDGKPLTPGTPEHAAAVEAFRIRKPGERCKASGRAEFFDAYSDRCPECGRVVRSNRHGVLPVHTVPKRLGRAL